MTLHIGRLAGAARRLLHVPQRFLLLAAGLVWTAAGGMLLARASAWLLRFGTHLVLRYAIALVGGLAFFFLLFGGISRKHVERIVAIGEPRPFLFSFFDIRAYLLMALMITTGVLVRTFRLIEPSLLFTFYACMGTPLLLAALRFYHAFASFEAPGLGLSRE